MSWNIQKPGDYINGPLTVTGSATITGDLTVASSILKVSGGNVGINTASPTNTAGYKTLEIVGTGVNTGGMIRMKSSDASVSSYDFVDNNGRGIFAVSNHNLRFGCNDIEQYRIQPLGIFTWYDGAGGTRMTLNSTGLGVGASPATKLDVRGTINGNQAIFTGTVNRGLVISTRSDGLADDRTVILNAQHSTGAQGQLVLQTVGTDRLLIDSSGNVGVGVTPSAWGGSYKALQLQSVARNIAATGAGLGDFTVAFNAIYDSTDSRWEYAGTGDKAGRYSQTGSGNHRWFVSNTAGTAGNEITDFASPAMTLDASGNLLVRKTVPSGSTLGCELLANGQINGATANLDNLNIYNTTAAAYRFYVSSAGTIFATNTTISAISDARFKENVEDIDVGLGAILALKPRKFDWKDGKGKNIKGDRGFIAQEFETVFPNLIDEWKDNAPEGEAPYKSVRQDLIPVLVKAIQELTARVEALEA